MAKRKRLSPANPAIATERAPEIKATLGSGPVGQAKTRPPIADVAQDAATSAAFSEVAQTLSEARAEGRLIQKLPIAAIQLDYLVRDRIPVDSDETATLMASLRARGQQTAIEVADLGDGRYGLISGWRRTIALRALDVSHVLAIIRAPDDAADAYLAMVEENEIRVDLSYYERARIAVRATDQGVYRTDRLAVSALFHAASRAKRSKIGSFVQIVRRLDDVLRFPTAMTERSGLALVRVLTEQQEGDDSLHAALKAANPQTAEEEAAVIAQIVSAAPAAPEPPLRETAKISVKSAVNSPAPAAAQLPKSAPESPEIPVGLRYKTRPSGGIVLTGTLLEDAGFKARLLAFLEAEQALIRE